MRVQGFTREMQRSKKNKKILDKTAPGRKY
jgi:hypothetical protein